jgi:hypothetical protein
MRLAAAHLRPRRDIEELIRGSLIIKVGVPPQWAGLDTTIEKSATRETI